MCLCADGRSRDCGGLRAEWWIVLPKRDVNLCNFASEKSFTNRRIAIDSKRQVLQLPDKSALGQQSHARPLHTVHDGPTRGPRQVSAPDQHDADDAQRQLYQPAHSFRRRATATRPLKSARYAMPVAAGALTPILDKEGTATTVRPFGRPSA